jgi:hypothetical protein
MCWSLAEDLPLRRCDPWSLNFFTLRTGIK